MRHVRLVLSLAASAALADTASVVLFGSSVVAACVLAMVLGGFSLAAHDRPRSQR